MRHSTRLADFLFGRRSARRSLLEELFSEPAARIHLRELARMTGYSVPMVAKELDGLVREKVVRESREANTRVFQADMRSPLAADISRIAARPAQARRTGTGKRSAPAATGDAAHRRPRTLQEAADWGATLGRRDAFLREFLDEFYGAEDAARSRMLAAEPALTPGDERADAYYAAVAEHLALRHGLPVPPWALAQERFLRRPFFPAGLESLKSTLLVESPPAFRRRMIFIGADALSRPRRSARADTRGSSM